MKIIWGILVLILFRIITADAQWMKVQDANINLASFADNGGSRLYMTAYGGVYISSNNGANWFPGGPGLQPNKIVYCVAAKDTVAYLCTDGELYKSTNSGLNWTQSLYGYTSFRGMNLQGNYIYIARSINLLRTSNNGLNWSYTSSGLPSNPGLTCVTSSGSRVYTAGFGTNGVYVSTNNGNNWTKAGTEIPNGMIVYTLYAKDNLVMAATDNGVYISVNYGNNWRLISEIIGYVGNYGLASYNTDIIFISAWGSGVYVSTNSGLNWNNWSQGIMHNSYNGMYCVNGYVFCGTIDAIYRRPLAEVGIRKISGAVPDKFALFQNFPNPFNPSTTIKFSLPPSVNGSLQKDIVRLSIYDITGKKVAEPVNQLFQPGIYEIIFDGSSLHSGTFFCVLASGTNSKAIKILLIK